MLFNCIYFSNIQVLAFLAVMCIHATSPTLWLLVLWPEPRQKPVEERRVFCDASTIHSSCNLVNVDAQISDAACKLKNGAFHEVFPESQCGNHGEIVIF